MQMAMYRRFHEWKLQNLTWYPLLPEPLYGRFLFLATLQPLVPGVVSFFFWGNIFTIHYLGRVAREWILGFELVAPLVSCVVLHGDGLCITFLGRNHHTFKTLAMALCLQDLNVWWMIVIGGGRHIYFKKWKNKDPLCLSSRRIHRVKPPQQRLDFIEFMSGRPPVRLDTSGFYCLLF